MTIRPPNAQELEKKEWVQRQAEADRGQLLLRQPFVGALIMRMDLVPVCDFRLTTAATDGTNIFLDCAFYENLAPDERIFLLAHEVWHCVFLHFNRRLGRELKRWNIAADLEIQFAMADENMKNPCPLSFDPKWTAFNAEAIYDVLPAQSTRTGAMDEHLERGSESTAATTAPASASAGDKDKPDDNNDDATGEETTAPAADSLIMDPDYAPYFVPDLTERTRCRVVAAARQVERMRGKLPGNLERLLAEYLEPQLPWQELMAQFVTLCYGGKRRWLPPSRRHVAQGLYLPSLRSEKLKAVVAIDSSGSTIADLPQFFGELNALLTSFGGYELTVIQCDTRVQSVEIFTSDTPCDPSRKWRVRGYGGTNFNPVFDYIQQHPELAGIPLLFFTDGYGPAPEYPPPFPVLWILCKNGKAPAPWGTVVKM